MWSQKKMSNARLTRMVAVCALLAVGLIGCSDDEAISSGDFNYGSPGYENDNEGGGGSDSDQEPDFIPETPEDFAFSAPAIVGDNVYVANETLNSLAVIDSRNLAVRTILAGSRPTEVVGPGAEGAADEEARVMALNEGSSTVTVIDPDDQSTTHFSVLPRVNHIRMAPGGRHSVVWFDSERAEADEPAGDLSAVSVVSSEGSFQVAVGFHVRDVRFDAQGQRALVITDDGVSVLKLNEIESDSFSPPRDLIPESKEGERVRDLELNATSDGRYVIGHRPGDTYLIVADLDDGESFAIELGAAPTGIALRESEDEVELLAVLRSEGVLLRATVPDGLRFAHEGQEAVGLFDPDIEEPDAGVPDAGEPDAGEPDAGEPDAGEPDAELWMEYEEFGFVDLPFVGPGSISVSADNEEAFLFTTVGDERRAILLNLEDEEARIVLFEKTIRGVLGDGRGGTFLVFHDRQPGSTVGLSPIDPEFVERSFGFTILDVRTGTRRLTLTELDLDEAALWSPEFGDAMAFLTFAAPESGQDVKPAHNDVVRVNLGTFRKDSFRLSSLPDGLGLIPAAEKVYVNQLHPQGRMTFVDVVTNERQTVTGYQLNAGVQ